MDIRRPRQAPPASGQPTPQQPIQPHVRMRPIMGAEIAPVQPAAVPTQPPVQPQPSKVAPQVSVPNTPIALPIVSIESATTDPRLVDAPQTLQPVPAPAKPRWSVKKIALWVCVGLVLLFVAVAAAGVLWYNNALTPVSAGDTSKTRVTVVSGSTPTQIAALLHDKQLIRSTTAFDIYTKLAKNRNNLQAGSYVLSPSQSLSQIVDEIVSGKTENFSITFFPGGTLTDHRKDIEPAKKMDVESVLLRAGFDQAAITAAFAKQYAGSLFADKPAGASLEGYIYGDTYTIDSSMTVEQVLQMTFNEYAKVVANNDLVASFKKQGLNLHQGIIMASIVQGEMGVHKADMAQVAQVFLKRYSEGVPLGSDVTAYYGADQVSRPRTVIVDTPYNTRMHAGLPAGPIGNPGLAALKAVANPAPGNYNYFLSGDDGTTYFAVTNEQHEANTVHCKKLCAMQ